MQILSSAQTKLVDAIADMRVAQSFVGHEPEAARALAVAITNAETASLWVAVAFKAAS